MSRELPGYRDRLQEVTQFFGGKQILTIGDVRRYTGMVDPRTIRRHFPFGKRKFITLSEMAWALCVGGQS